MLRWSADTALAELIRRYYTGEAALWESIRQRVHEELRQRRPDAAAYHFRFRETETGYDIIIEDARDFVAEY